MTAIVRDFDARLSALLDIGVEYVTEAVVVVMFVSARTCVRYRALDVQVCGNDGGARRQSVAERRVVRGNSGLHGIVGYMG